MFFSFHKRHRLRAFIVTKKRNVTTENGFRHTNVTIGFGTLFAPQQLSCQVTLGTLYAPQQVLCQVRGKHSFLFWGPQFEKLSLPIGWHTSCYARSKSRAKSVGMVRATPAA